MRKSNYLQKTKTVFTIIILCSAIGFSQKESFEYLSTEDYQLINDIFGQSAKGNKKYVYHRTYFDKSWKRYFENTNLIYDNVGLPAKVSDSSLKSMLTAEAIDKFHNEIVNSVPLKLKKSKLREDIVLTKEYDTKQALANRVRRISKPIISGDLGIIRMLTYNEAPIFIVQKKNNKWHVIYTFYDWSILD